MTPGQIILLNGTSSSGKSTLARALQDVLDEPYLHTGIDHFLERYPSRLIVYSDGVTPPSAEGWLAVFRDNALAEMRLGPAGLRFITGMYQSIAALSAAGVNCIVDDVIYDPRVLQAALSAFKNVPVFFVGLRCPLAIAEQWEQARGNRAPGGARTFHPLVHAHGLYDFEIDPSLHAPAECAQLIKAALPNPTQPDAFRHLRQ